MTPLTASPNSITSVLRHYLLGLFDKHIVQIQNSKQKYILELQLNATPEFDQCTLITCYNLNVLLNDEINPIVVTYGLYI